MVVIMAVAGGMAAAQPSYPIFTVSHLSGTMEALGPNFRATSEALGSEDYQIAKERITRSREQLARTITFWRQNNRDDAVKILRQTVEKMDALDELLSMEIVDYGAGTALLGEIGIGCGACHDIHREQDPDTNEYRLRPGSVE